MEKFAQVVKVKVEIGEDGFPFRDDDVCWRCEKHGKVRWFEGAWLCDVCLKKLLKILEGYR